MAGGERGLFSALVSATVVPRYNTHEITEIALHAEPAVFGTGIKANVIFSPIIPLRLITFHASSMPAQKNVYMFADNFSENIEQ